MGSFSPTFEGRCTSGGSIYQSMEGLGPRCQQGSCELRWSTASFRLLWIKWLTVYRAQQLPGAGDVAGRDSLARKPGALVSWSYDVISPTTSVRGVLVGELTIGPVRVTQSWAAVGPMCIEPASQPRLKKENGGESLKAGFAVEDLGKHAG